MRLIEFVHKTYWHGSKIAGLENLQPRYSEIVGKRVVFAATFEEVAVAMSGHWTDQDFSFGRSMSKDADPDRVPYKMKELKAGAFEKFFSEPISLYEVNGRDFHDNPSIQDFEVIANKSVKVIDEKVIDNPLDYLKSAKMVKLKFAEISEAINNQGDLGRLEAVLSLWGEGKTKQAQAPLLALEPLARNYRLTNYPSLYRGMLIDDPATVRRTGLVINTPSTAPLSSWARSAAAVREFMYGWERPWCLISMPGDQLDVFIDLSVFHKQAKPFQQMHTQREVIVKMPPTLTVPATQLRVFRR